jgi:hypothetical protein
MIAPDPEVDADLLLMPGVTETTDHGPVGD